MTTVRYATAVAAALIAVAALAGGTVLADEVLLKNGRTVEGEVTEKADGYYIKTAGGITMTIPKDQVANITRGKTRHQTYYDRAEALADDDVAGRLELARWCAENDLETEATLEFESVLRQDPDNDECHRALDHVQHKGVWISRAEYMETLGFVKYRGRFVTEEEADQLEEKADAKKLGPKVKALIREAAAVVESPARTEARAELDELRPSAVVRPLIRSLRDGDKGIRYYAAEKLGEVKSETAVKPLARAATGDRYNTVRFAALHSLKDIDSPTTVDAIAPALFSKNPYSRIHAMNAMNVFPSRKGAYYLIRKLRHESMSFSRVHVSFTTQRAYVRDFELSSGGTGLAIAEVADPIVDVFTEGVILDVKIRRVEWEQTVAVLKGITGVSHGTDAKAWTRWWKDNGETFAVQDPLAEKDESGG